MKLLSIITFAFATSTTLAAPAAPSEIRASAAEYIAQFEREYGRWAVENAVMSGPGQFKELRFVVETGPALAGLGVRSVWFDTDSGKFFGEIIRTFNPATSAVEQHYFAAERSAWSSRSQEIRFTDAGYESAFSGEDQYGEFDARATTTFLPDGAGYDWTIERRYKGGDWFLIDRGAARALPKGD